ncbi:hypothetical protein BGX33_001799 [Mortierella sp. NVP41]|nr:hypothetical protein BGX33_001799 [Mortierella sp. NVP41]
MMGLFSIIAIVDIVAMLLSTVLTQEAMIATPTASTVWDAGHTITIQWKPQTPGDLTRFEVDLFTGANPTSMTLVAALGTGNPGAISLTVTLPGRLALSRGPDNIEESSANNIRESSESRKQHLVRTKL